jgi:hypothetical protein
MAQQMVATVAGLLEFAGTTPGRLPDADGSPFTIHYLADHPPAGTQLAAWLHQEWPNTYTSEKALATIESSGHRDCLPLTFFACKADLNLWVW